jgi:hypothetical protein
MTVPAPRSDASIAQTFGHLTWAGYGYYCPPSRGQAPTPEEAA